MFLPFALLSILAELAVLPCAAKKTSSPLKIQRAKASSCLRPRLESE